MDSDYIVLLIFTVIIASTSYVLMKFTQWIVRRYYRGKFRGNLLDDYVRNHPDLIKKSRIYCVCGNGIIDSKALGFFRRKNAAAVREHYCRLCKRFLYYSGSGSYFEKIMDEVRRESKGIVSDPSD